VARFRHPYEYSPSQSASIMAEIINTDSLRKNIKELKLLHTDGLQTVETVVFLKKALKEIGIELKTQSVAMFPLVDWENELIKGDYDFFLMGFKAENYPQENSLICPLLESSSSVNFFRYRNNTLDETCRLSQKMDIDLISQVMDDLPFLPLFYIEAFSNE
jgi:ABC-type transport system substrate-binding protein